MPELLSETTVLPSMGQVIGGQDERGLTSRVRLAVGEAGVEKLEASLRLSVVIPCLLEAATIQECVRRAQHALDANDIEGEVVVADNGSDDGSAVLAASEGARVVDEPERGYGSAYLV